MELALSLGDTTPKPFSFLEKSQKILGTDLGFCMAVGKVCGDSENRGRISKTYEDHRRTSSSSDPPPVQLDLLPFSPLHSTHPSSHKLSFPWLTQNLISEQGKRVDQESEEGAISQLSSPNSAISSFQMDFSSAYINSAGNNKRNYNNSHEGEADRGASSRGSDEDENVFARKKLRLSKQQSAFLEDTFKEHNTLNPKEKLNLAKQLNLSPRQVEVWFQNRRARTKLKQTEVDCEYLKRCCETLTEENKRLKKELQELRALKASKPFYMQLPATTLTMCSSCERVAAAAAAATATAAAAPAAANNPNELFSLSTGDAHDE